MEEQNKTDYEFVTETIKKKPVNKKRLVHRLIQSVGFGILAGISACLIFAVFAPKIYKSINPDEPDLITIPEDEQVIESVPESIEQKEEVKEEPIEETPDEATDEVKEVSIAEDEVTDPSENTEDSEEGKESENSEESEKSEENDYKRTIIIQKEDLTLADYKTFYRELSEVANVAKRSIVSVTGVTDSTDWFNNSYEMGNVSSGLIVADNGKELLIITNAERLEASKGIEVKFCDGKSYKGSVKKADSSTGLVVVAVVLDEIDDSTKNSYAKAELGNSTIPTLVGTPVLAIGAPLGIENSVASGVVTSNTRDIVCTDFNIRYITTDIYGSTEGSGVLIDLDGKVLGIIFQGGTSADTKNLIHAYSISDIKSKIEKLSNGQDTAYLGIIGTDVTEKAMNEQGVPEGAYVKQVVVDSPAMKSGIQNGDVIIQLGTTNIRSFRDYRVAMGKCQPGDTTMVTVKRLGKDGYIEVSYEIYLEALK